MAGVDPLAAFRDLVGYQIARVEAELPPLTAPAGYDYVLAAGGVFKRARSRHVAATALIAPGAITGLAALEPKVELLVPRLPSALLEMALTDARAAGGIETAYQLVLTGKKVDLVKLPQLASRVRVDYQHGGGTEVVLELHSHVDAVSRFSDTDNRDQQGFRFYAVLGRIHTEPEIRMRLGLHGDWVELPITTLFRDSGPFRDCVAPGLCMPAPSSKRFRFRPLVVRLATFRPKKSHAG